MPAIDRLAADTAFSGVVRVDRAGAVEFAKAYGLADRRHSIPNTLDTQFGLASGGKSLTALAVVSLIADGVLSLDTSARSLLGSDLPLVGDDVTVEHLLAHRSGIGEYLDDDAPSTEYLLAVPMQELATTEDYLVVLDGHPTAFPAGERFSYCNGGYVVLALLAERASGVGYHELVGTRVCEPAGLRDTEFLRSDELPRRAAVGYLQPDGLRTNVFHLPVRGSGDGGVYSTAADVSALWHALFAGRIVPELWLEEMLRPRSDVPGEGLCYGLGLWLHESRDVPIMMGMDAGVSFRSAHDPATATTLTVIANDPRGAWPMARLLDRLHGL